MSTSINTVSANANVNGNIDVADYYEVAKALMRNHADVIKVSDYKILDDILYQIAMENMNEDPDDPRSKNWVSHKDALCSIIKKIKRRLKAKIPSSN